jgi:hypothetical protein
LLLEAVFLAGLCGFGPAWGGVVSCAETGAIIAHNTHYETEKKHVIILLNKNMAQLDTFHHVVKSALQKDGWKITDDPLYLQYGGIDYAIDFGAEPLIAAEKEHQKVAIEVKSFLAGSPTYEFHKVVGQFFDYRMMLKRIQPDRILYVAVPSDIYRSFFQTPFIREVIQEMKMKIAVYNIDKEEIEEWIN